jgi:hypothetical protein
MPRLPLRPNSPCTRSLESCPAAMFIRTRRS